MASLEIETEKIKEQRDRYIAEAMLEQFYSRWAPRDSYDAKRFGVDLHMLFRQIYREAQEPAFKQLEAIMRCLPTIPFLAEPK